MLKIEKYAAIDIGSNAIRLLISSAIIPKEKPPKFMKSSLVRVPIRLGADVFKTGSISTHNAQRMQDAIKAFQLIAQTHGVVELKAYATSAMREADNADQIVQCIKENSGINIEIIDGTHEAAMIALTDLNTLIDDYKTYLYVDVGGGSTEFTLYHQGKTIDSKSFQLGTVRILEDLITKEEWNTARDWVENITADFRKIYLIGSGGNINNVFKNSGKREGKPLTYFYLSAYYNSLQKLSYEERILEHGLKEDRADVIIPALKIYLSAMKWCRSKNIYVPKIGLSDGIIKSIYNRRYPDRSPA